MDLVVAVENGSAWVTAHASCAHFVNDTAGDRLSIETGDVLDVRRLQQLDGIVHHLRAHATFVVSISHRDVEHRHAPGILALMIEPHPVVAFCNVAKARDVHAGRAASTIIGVRQSRIIARRAATIVMIHQIMAEHAAVVAEAIRESR